MKGRYRYDGEYDVLTFRLLEGRYDRSLEIGDVVLDLDRRGCVVGLRVFDASMLFGLEKEHLIEVEDFRFSCEFSDGFVSLRIRFTPISNAEPLLEQHLTIVRELPVSPA